MAAKPEWGTKQTCPKCGERFYDLGKNNPVTCIACGTSWTPEPVLKSKQPLAAVAKPEKKVKDKSVDDDDLDDDDIDLDDDDIELDDDDDDDDDVLGDVSLDDDDTDVSDVIDAKLDKGESD